MRHLLHKSAVLGLSAVALSALGLLAYDAVQAPPPVPAPQLVDATVDEEIVFHGSVEQSWREDWNSVQKYGIYRFTFDSSISIEGPVSQTHTTGGGFFLDGYYYCVSGTQTSSKVMNHWVRYNTETWSKDLDRYFETPTLTDSDCLAYDYISGTAYAAGRNLNNKETPYELRTVNIATGEMTNVGRLEQRFSAMAFDSNGQLWGIARDVPFPYATKLYKIDKATGATTYVGDLGYNQKSNYAAACFDHRNGKFYWTTQTFTYNNYNEETYYSALFEVDLSTGKATPVKDFPDREIFNSLYIADSHPKAPEAAKNLNFTYSQGSVSAGTLNCTLPVNAYDRSALSGALKVEFYIDGLLIDTKTGAQPGSTVSSKEVTLADGKHKARVNVYTASGLKSLATVIDIYGGSDKPATVQNLQMSLDPYATTATLTWEPPTTGANLGYLDASQLTYKVISRTDGQAVLAEGLKECRFVYEVPRVQEITQFDVIAVTPAGESDAVHTTPAIIGQGRDFPYLETFDSYNAFYRFTCIDPRGINDPNGDRWMYYPQKQCAIYWLDYDYYRTVDGWLITPAMNFKENYVYRISWVTQGFSSVAGENSMHVRAGEFPTIESLKSVVYDVDFSLEKNESQTFSTLFVAGPNDRHIGFHALGNGKDHVSLDNLRITEQGPSTVPGAPTLISAGANDEGQAVIRVKLPTVDAIGNPVKGITSVRLYTADMRRLIATSAVEAGVTEVEVIDPSPVNGMNEYAVSAINADGRGLDLMVSLNLKPDAPKDVENFVVRTASDGRDASLSWNYPADMLGVDGNTLTAEQITYDIYRLDGFNKVLVQSVPGTESAVVLDNVLADLGSTRQKELTFSLVARTEGGVSEGVTGSGIFGAAYELPIYENFASNGQLNPYDTSRSSRSSFAMTPTGYDPRVDALDTNVLSFIPSSDGGAVGMFISPRINMTGLLNPKLSFTVYESTSSELTNATVQVGIITEKDGVEQDVKYISGSYSVKASEDGWKTYTIDLGTYATSTRASFVLRCISSSRKGRIHFDNVTITGDRPDTDVRALRVSGPGTALMGRDNNYYVTIDNYGTNDLENVAVTLLAGDTEIGSATTDINSGEELSLPFTFTPALDAEEETIVLTARVAVEGDANRFNNEANMRVKVEAPNLPYVTDLYGFTDDQGRIHLLWSDATYYPKEQPVTDNIESYPDFAINNIGNWITYDLDEGVTLSGISSNVATFTWENCGMPQAYIVFNPASVGVTGLCTPHSGSRCLVSFTSAAGNNDWLVSPQLSGHSQTMSFYARHILSSAGEPEIFSVMVSYSGTDIDDFVPLREDISVAHDSWEKYSFDLPAGVRHFAIVCKSVDSFGLMLDDFEYVPAQPEVELTGYNVYRHGILIAEGLGETEHIDSDIDPNELYRYHVTATYTDGESIYSNPFDVCAASVAAVGDDEATIYATAGQIVVKAPTGSPVTVHTIDGRCIYSFASTGDERLDVATGIYIVRAGEKTAKLIVR